VREIIFDTETTGLSPGDGDRIIEIGAVELINHVPSGKTYHRFLNPGDRQVHPDALAVHGISNEQLENEPDFAEIADEFLEFFGEGRLIAHNANFDIGFFDAEMKRIGLKPFPRSRVLDTLAMARLKYPGARNSLDALCSRYGIDNSHREKHGALLDSELLAEVYIELIGGKQASLVLSADGQGQQNDGEEQTEQIAQEAWTRSKPLEPRLTEKEKESHEAFLDSFGTEALWKRLG
jgi:DNA polymerase-3 subunit epsilon